LETLSNWEIEMRLLLTVPLLLVAASLHAAPVTWTLDGVNFEDGGMATGSFDYDAITNSYTSIAINFSGGADDTLYAGLYDLLREGDSNSLLTDAYGCGSFNEVCSLLLEFETDLTNAGGVIALGGSSSIENIPNLAYQDVTAGNVIASVVPIPAAVWLFGSGLGLLGWFRRRQTA
jgi:hypothetical protein